VASVPAAPALVGVGVRRVVARAGVGDAHHHARRAGLAGAVAVGDDLVNALDLVAGAAGAAVLGVRVRQGRDVGVAERAKPAAACGVVWCRWWDERLGR